MASIASNPQNRMRFLARARVRPKEKRTVIGQLILIFFLCLPLEGIIRKWLFPQAEQIFGFIRDPILLAIYFIYFKDKFPRFPRWFRIYLFVAVPFSVFSLLFVILTGSSLILAFIGIRGYVMYIPLAFIMPEVLSRADIRRFFILTLWISIPIALLVFLQFKSPVAAYLNKGTSDAIEGRFTVAFGIVRPYGPFTFAQAQNTYAALMVAIVLICWEYRSRYAIPAFLLLAGAASTLTMGALSGGRTFFAHAGLVCLAYAAAALTSPTGKDRFRRVILLGSIAVTFVLVFVLVFPTSFRAMSERQRTTELAHESLAHRELSAFTNAAEPLEKAPVFGYGPGAGSNAATQLTQSTQLFLYGENDWERNVYELGPFFGLAVLAFRTLFTIWLGVIAYQSNRRSGDAEALVMFGFCGYLVLLAQVTGQNQILSFSWFSVGILLVLRRLSGPDARPAVKAKSVRRPAPRTAQGV